jgi:streptogramin lyase
MKWILLAALGALCACGGGGGGGASALLPSASPSASATATPASTPNASTNVVTFVVTIPSSAPASAARRRATTSSNTGSIVFTLQSVNGVAAAASATTVAAVGPTATGCSASASGTTCNLPVTAPIGNDLFAIATYQSNNGTGTPLASTNVAVATSSTTSASVTLDLGGIPASLTFSPARLPLVNDGNVHRVAVTINAADASGATIVGATYQSPVSLQIENDPAGALSLSTASVSQPGSVVTVTYNAAKPLNEGEIVASDNAMTAATLIAAPLSITPAPITMFDTTASTAVTLTEGGFTGSYTVSVANAADASTVVNPGTLGSGTAVANVTPQVRFDVTSLAVSDGNVTANVPLAIVPQPTTYSAFGPQHQLLNAIAMIPDGHGNFWASDQGTGSLVEFSTATDAYTSYVVDPSLNGPLGIAFDANGNLWFADGPQIGEFNTSTQAVTTYSSGLEANAFVSDIIAGPSGTMWFYDQATSATYPSGAPTYFGSIATSSGAIAEYENNNGAGPTHSAMSMVLANDGSIWFADQLNMSVGHINTSNGTVTEYATGTPAYPQQSPMQLVVAPNGKIWFVAAGFTSNNATAGYVDPSNNNAITYDTNMPGNATFTALTVGSDGNLWFFETPGTVLLSSQPYIGVINPSDGAIYQYTTVLPQFSKGVTLLNGGNGTLWMLDTAYGQIGEVTFK